MTLLEEDEKNEFDQRRRSPASDDEQIAEDGSADDDRLRVCVSGVWCGRKEQWSSIQNKIS